MKNNKELKTAAIIAILGNAVLSVSKITAGLISGSAALTADGIDSAGDVFVSVVTLVIVKVISKPADKEHPWGHRRAETIATAFLAFILFFMGAQLIIHSISNVFAEEVKSAPSVIAIIVTLASIAGKILLALNQYSYGKRANSKILMANAKNMASDVLVSAGVLVGLIISSLTGVGFADIIIEALIGAWIIKTALGIFLEANRELMDGGADSALYHSVFEAVNSVKGASHPHRARIRSIAGFWDIALDVYVAPDLTIKQAHNISIEIEKAIKSKLENVFDVMLHIEPLPESGDASPEEEPFGLSEDMEEVAEIVIEEVIEEIILEETANKTAENNG